MKRKTMKSKGLALALAAALATGILGGCGDTKKGEESKVSAESQSVNAQTTTESAEEVQETVPIVWYVYYNGVNADEDEVEAAINEYIEPLIGVTVDIRNKQTTDLKLALAAGEEIDLFWTASWDNGKEYAKGNSALALTDLLPEYEELYNSIPESIWEAAQINGENYYVPVYKESASGSGVALVKELVDKYNFDISTVKTPADLTPLLAAAYADGLDSPFCTKNFSEAAWNSRNGYIDHYMRVDENGTVVNRMETQEYEDFIKLMYEWNQAGYINQDEINAESGIDVTKIQAGETVCVSWSNTPDDDANATARYGVEMVTINFSGYYIESDSAYMINAKTEKADACLKLLQLLYTDQKLADLMCYGIEGKHYNRTADDRVELIADSGYVSGGVWATTNVKAPSLMVGESADKKEQYDIFNNNAEKSICAGFQVDSTNIDAEMTSCTAVRKEYKTLLDRGFYDPEEYLPKLREALKAAGVDKVIEEVQKQYDAWQASNN